MNIKQAKEEIKHTIHLYLEKDEDGRYLLPALRQRPIFLMGAPGIGKTAIMEQIARECGIALVAYTITHHTRQSALGLPFIREREYGGQVRSVTEYTMSEIIASVYERMETSGQKEGILFLDEVNCVSETLAPTMLQFLQTKTFGNTKLPEGWIVATAGNPPEYNKSVREFDVATLDRVKYMRVEADYGIWKEYARTRHLHGSILSYLDNKKENFYRMETAIDGKRFVTARGWEDLSALLYGYERAGFSVDREVVYSYVQDRSVAVDFANYLELYRKYEEKYQVADILSGKEMPDVKKRLKEAPFDERISLTGLLLSGLSDELTQWQEREAYTDELFDWLKEYKRKLETEKVVCQDVAARLMNQVAEEAESLLSKRQAGGLLTREEDKRKEKVLGVLREYRRRILEKETWEDAFEPVREWFGGELKKRDQLTENVGRQLENAFSFLEQCFCTEKDELTAGPEMIYFVTELEADQTSLSYIRDNGCEAYYRYSKSLFLDEKRQGLLKELDSYFL